MLYCMLYGNGGICTDYVVLFPNLLEPRLSADAKSIFCKDAQLPYHFFSLASMILLRTNNMPKYEILKVHHWRIDLSEVHNLTYAARSTS